MMRKFKFFDGITDNSYVFHAGFMQPIPVEQRERRLQDTLSQETTQELSTYHGIDAVDELSRLLAQEIDNEILREMVDIANRVDPPTEQTLLDILTSDTTIETDEEVIRGVETLTRNWNGGERA